MRHNHPSPPRRASAAGAWLLIAILAGGLFPLGGGARAGDPDVYTNCDLSLRIDADPDAYSFDHAALDAAAQEWAGEIAAGTSDSGEAEAVLEALRARAAAQEAAPIWQRLSALCHLMFQSLGF